MRKQEQRLWDNMRRHAPKGVWMQRVENLVGEGMPDVWVAPAAWVELKAPHLPKRSTTPLLGKDEGLRPAQINWHLKAAKSGVTSYVLIRDDQQNLYLLAGAHAAAMNSWPAEFVAEMSLARTWNGIWGVLLSCKQSP